VSLTQQFILLAQLTCIDVQHVARPDVAHIAKPEVTLNKGPVIDTGEIEIPVTVDVLRGRQGGNRPLLGEVNLGLVSAADRGALWKSKDGKKQPLSGGCPAPAPKPKPAK
jgi:hypothetical protein